MSESMIERMKLRLQDAFHWADDAMPCLPEYLAEKLASAAIEIAAAEIQRIHREAEAKYPHCPGDSDCSDLEEFSVRVREHFGLVEAAAKG